MFPLSIPCYSNGQRREPAAIRDCCAAGSHLTTPSNIDFAIGLVVSEVGVMLPARPVYPQHQTWLVDPPEDRS